MRASQSTVGMRWSSHRSYFLPLMATLVTAAWLTLWLWEQSPYGRYLNHGQWNQVGLAASLCRAIPLGGVLVPAAFYVTGWTLMTAAMMLPTTFPLLDIYRRLTHQRRDRILLMALLVSGYLGVWAAFGVLAHVVDWGVHELAERSIWLQFNAWVFGAATLMLAGAFQFSSLKYRCLEKCHTPLSFVTQYWRGRRERSQAFLLGVNHGIFCVGCCWALMLLMFVVGTGSVGWMLALGVLMAIEKNTPWGRRFSTPLGLVLIGWGGFILLHHAWPGSIWS